MGIMKGTIRWKWLDEDGMEHTFSNPNSFYVPSGKVCLSPQHWAQYAKDGRHGRCVQLNAKRTTEMPPAAPEREGEEQNEIDRSNLDTGDLTIR